MGRPENDPARRPLREGLKAETRRSLQLPERPEAFISQLQSELDSAYARTRESLHRENPIFEVAGGRLDLEKLDALEEPDSLIWLRSRQYAMIPDAELPDLLLEIAARTRFLEAFTTSASPAHSFGTLTSRSSSF